MSLNSGNLKKREYRSFSGGENESHPTLRLVRELVYSRWQASEPRNTLSRQSVLFQLNTALWDIENP